MNFIIDTHLPRALTAFFSGYKVIHTLGFPEGNLTYDPAINELSILEKIVSYQIVVPSLQCRQHWFGGGAAEAISFCIEDCFVAHPSLRIMTIIWYAPEKKYQKFGFSLFVYFVQEALQTCISKIRQYAFKRT